MSSLMSLVADLHKPFSGMIEADWYEGIDYVEKPDTRSNAEIAADEAQDELNSRYVRD